MLAFRLLKVRSKNAPDCTVTVEFSTLLIVNTKANILVEIPATRTGIIGKTWERRWRKLPFLSVLQGNLFVVVNVFLQSTLVQFD